MNNWAKFGIILAAVIAFGFANVVTVDYYLTRLRAWRETRDELRNLPKTNPVQEPSQTQPPRRMPAANGTPVPQSLHRPAVPQTFTFTGFPSQTANGTGPDRHPRKTFSRVLMFLVFLGIFGLASYGVYQILSGNWIS